jgi:hypothetical protein
MYKLTRNHYKNLDILALRYEDNLYDINTQFILEVSDKNLIVQVLDYYVNYDLNFINKDNCEEVLSIFLYFGTEIGNLFDLHYGYFCKKIRELKDIDINNNTNEEDYIKVIKFKKEIFNYDNRMKYDKMFNLCFEMMEFNMDILDYEKYNIKTTYSNDCFLGLDKNALKVYIGYGDDVKKDNLPYLLTHIIFGDFFGFYNDIEDDVFPNSLEHIVFSGNFTQKITKKLLPKTLKTLEFGHESCFNYKIGKKVLPPFLKKLHFGCGSAFNQIIDIDVLPPLLEDLDLGYNYNQKINAGVLPLSLRKLTFGYEGKYNIKFETNVLPQYLTHLIFDMYHIYNQKIEKGVLPQYLTHLIFKEGCHYNQKIEKDVLPQYLTNLIINGLYNQKIKKGVLPQHLTHLTLTGRYNQKIEEGVLPQSLTHLTLRGHYNQKIEKRVLPQSLTHLDIKYNKVIGNNIFINSLTNLTIYMCKDTQLEIGLLPKSLISLTICGNFNQKIVKGLFPDSLQFLTIISPVFDSKIESDALPESLVSINLKFEKYSQKIINKLHSSLKYLSFGIKYNYTIKRNMLPKSLISFNHGNSKYDGDKLENININIPWYERLFNCF